MPLQLTPEHWPASQALPNASYAPCCWRCDLLVRSGTQPHAWREQNRPFAWPVPIRPSSRPPALNTAQLNHIPVIAPLRFKGIVPDLIRGFKYRRQLSHGRLLTRMLLRELVLHSQQGSLAEVLIPIAPTQQRLRQRGFSHSHKIAAGLARPLGITSIVNISRKGRPAQQAGLSKTARAQNVKDSFYLDPSMFLPWQNLAIVDDVITTGATVAELATKLQSMSRRYRLNLSIQIWALASVELQ